MPTHRRRRAFLRLFFEELEERRLLTITTTAQTPLAPPYYPPAIIAAYGVNQIPAVNGTAINGAGQTIAIMATATTKTAAQLTADLHAFDTNVNINLPDAPSISVVAAPVPKGQNPQQVDNPNTDAEEDMDIEWAHAMAPGANIVVVVSPLNYYNGDPGATETIFDAAMKYAASLPGVSVVSASYGFAPNRGVLSQSAFSQAPGEVATETGDDSDFLTPSSHQGVTFVVCTQDDGFGSYPAMSPNVVAVGGTSLTINAATTTNTATTPPTITTSYTYNNEVYWNSPLGGPFAPGSGGFGVGGQGLSAYESEPFYQLGFQSTGKRSVPDVSMDGDYDNTPVQVYFSDPANGIAGGFISTGDGGTSLSTPLFAGLMADADQERVLLGGTTLDGPSQTLPALYQMAGNGDFNQMATASYIAGTTIPTTGLGSPKANFLVPDLASFGLADQFAIQTPQTQTITFGSPLIVPASGTFNLTVDNVTVAVTYPAIPSQPAMVTAIQTALNNAPAPLGVGSTLVTADTNESSIDIAFTGSLALHSVPRISFNTGTLNGNSINGYAEAQTLTFSAPLTTQATGTFNLTVDGVTVPVTYPTSASQTAMVTMIQNALSGASSPLGANTTFVTAGPTTSTINITFIGALAGTPMAPITYNNGTLSGNSLSGPAITAGVNSEIQTITFANPLTDPATGTFNLVVDGVTIAVNYPVAIPPATTPTQASMVAAIQAALNSAPSPLGIANTFVAAGSTPSTITIVFIGALANANVPLITSSNGSLSGNSILPVNTLTVITAGIATPLALEAQDSSGGIDSSINGTVFANGVPVGTMVDGVANVSLTLTQASSTASVQFTVGSLTSPVTLDVVAGSPAQLLITTEPPSGVNAGSQFSVAVTAVDAFGNIVTGYTGTAVVAMLNNPTKATLGGVLSQTFSGGVATFTGLSIGTQGSGYTLVLSTQKVSVATPAITVFNALTITGTTNSNVSVAFPDSQHFTVTINGTTTQYSLAQYNRLVYLGPVGKFSKVVFDDPSRTYAAVQSLTSTQLVSSTFAFEADSVANLFVYAGSGSTANVTVGQGSGGNFYVDAANSGYSYIADPNDQIFSQLIGFGAETVSGSGGTTYAYVYSTSQASVVGDPAGSSVTVGGVKSTLGNFSQLYILGAADGSDQISLNSQGGEFVGTPTFSYVTGSYQSVPFIIGALYAANVSAQASTSGTDTAFFDSFANNVFNGSPGTSSLAGTALNALNNSYNFVTQAVGYPSVSVLESGGGTDSANLTSTGSGKFISTSTVDTLTVGSSTITVDTFVVTTSGSGTVLVPGASQVTVTGRGNSTDSAFLYDSPGANALVANGSSATLTTANGTLSISKFGALTAEHENGSSDTLHEGALDFVLATTGSWTSV